MAPIVTKMPNLECIQYTLDEYAHVGNYAPSAANAEVAAQRVWDPGKRSEYHGPNWFAGAKSLEEIAGLFSNGWKAGADRLTKQSKQVTPPEAKTRKRKLKWSADGDELDCDRAMRGECDPWRSAKRVVVNGPSTVELFALYGGNCNVSDEGLFWAGAACVIVADLLEAAGYSVKITAIWASQLWSRDNHTHMTMVEVKDYADPFQLDALATVMCHAGTFRSNGFRALNMASVHHGPSYGSSKQSWDASGYLSVNEAALKSLKESSLWSEGAILMNAPTYQAGCEDEIARVLALLQDS